MFTLKTIIYRVKGYLMDVDINPQLPPPRFEGPDPFAIGESSDEFQLEINSCLRSKMESLILESKLSAFDRLHTIL